jgi:PIN domain nuclease of toxin-antitoxin system
MDLLLDTHIFLWYISGAPQLPPVIRDHIRDPDNQVYLSVISVWEAILKHQLGKLPLPDRPETYLPQQRELHQIDALPLDEASVAQLGGLPPLHRDPFDRLLICQAIQHSMTLATVDTAIPAYPVAVLDGRP